MKDHITEFWYINANMHFAPEKMKITLGISHIYFETLLITK